MADTVLEQIAALKDEDWAVREDAAVALGGLRDKRAWSLSLPCCGIRIAPCARRRLAP